MVWPPVRTTRTPGMTVAVAVDQIEDAGLAERHVVLGEIARAVALVRMGGVLVFRRARDVARAGKRRHERGRRVAAREAAGVIEMQVRCQHDVDVALAQPASAQARGSAIGVRSIA